MAFDLGTATHEASHAVTSWALGRGTWLIEIDECGGQFRAQPSAGTIDERVAFSGLCDDIRARGPRAIEPEMADRLVVIMSGMAGSRYVDPRWALAGAEDTERAEELAAAVCPSPRVAERLLDVCWFRACRLVDQHADRIEHLAAVLLERRHLEGRELRELIDRAPPRRRHRWPSEDQIKRAVEAATGALGVDADGGEIRVRADGFVL